MANGVYIPMSSAVAANNRLEVVANNLANANTPGYKQIRTSFEQFLVDTPGNEAVEKGFTRLAGTATDISQGTIDRTGNPLDLAIEGDGFFMVDRPDGTLLTRAGSLRISADGTLVSPSGAPILSGAPGAAERIKVAPDGGPITVSENGDISQDGTVVATLGIVTANPDALTPLGAGTYTAPVAALAPVENPTLLSQHLEKSNVNPIRGMIDLIEVTKDYARSQKIMRKFRELERRAMQMAR